MTVSGKIGVSYLFPEFLANALVFFRPLQSAGAIATGTLQSLFYGLNHLFIIIQFDSHNATSLLRVL